MPSSSLLFPGVPPGTRAAWWSGNGGSPSFIDLDSPLAIGYVPNRWIGGAHEQDRSGNIVRTVYASMSGAR